MVNKKDHKVLFCVKCKKTQSFSKLVLGYFVCDECSHPYEKMKQKTKEK